MSILIKGMEMPCDGRYTLCITHDSNGGVHWVFQSQDTLEFLKHGDVIEVPEPHGRLIDADALKFEIQEYVDEYKHVDEYGFHSDKWCAMQEALLAVDDAATVIPAEEAE